MTPNKEARKNNNLLWRIHHWAGLYAGIIIGVLSLTGALAVFIPEIDVLVQRHYYAASSAPAATLQFSKSLAALTKKYPDYQSLSVDLPEKPGHAASIQLAVPDPVSKKTNRYNFFVDTGRDALAGSRIQANSLANYLRQMHVRLYEGFWGRQLVGLGGIALVVVVVTGLLIYGNFMKRQTYPQIRRGRGLRILLADWHKILGVSALLFNLVIGLTGAWLGLQPKLMTWLDMKAPNAFETPVIMDADADKAAAVDWPAALKAARQQFPDLQVSTIAPSSNGSHTLVFRGNLRGQVYERNINTLVLSKTALAPVYKYDVRTAGFWNKFYLIQEALHFGDFGGLTLKFLYALLGLVSGFLSISGFVVYISRTEKKQRRRQRPMKLVFLYTFGLVLILVAAALVSLFIGYDQAAFLMAVVINGGLAGWVCYLVGNYFLQKRKKMALA
jgi:uncharacterized iron-regulated membrane protein